jgi:7-carboxy-7-deazaguanine synthase
VTERCTAQEIYAYIKSTGAICVTLTGGEPLIQEGIDTLLQVLNDDPSLEVHVETNGSVDIEPFQSRFPNIGFIVDYKLFGSGMTDRMVPNNLAVVTQRDTYKFVVSSHEDLEQAAAVIEENRLCDKTQVFFSPVLGEIAPAEIVEFMKEQKLNRVRLQLQLHKVIWHPEERGV